MDWINLHTPRLCSDAFIEAPAAALGTWLRVLKYCVEQENSGRIVGAESWSARKWLQVCAVSRREVLAASPLLVAENGDIVVLDYPLDRQSRAQTNRVNGGRGGQARTQAKSQAARLNGAKRNPSGNPTEEEEEEEGKNNKNAHAVREVVVFDSLMTAKARICAILRLDPARPWTPDAERSLLDLMPIPEEEFEAIEWLHGLPADDERPKLLASPTSLTARWSDEVAKARALMSERQVAEPQKKNSGAPPADEWNAWLSAKGYAAVSWEQCDSSVRREFRQERSAA
jgi:hypothetical protein